MYKQIFVLLALSVSTLASCQVVDTSEMSYETKQLNIYRKKDEVDKQIPLRFYESTPNIPYISVKQFYKEFFNINLSLNKSGHLYKYILDAESSLKFDSDQDVLFISNFDAFSVNPDFKTSVSSTFLKGGIDKVTTPREKVISLKNYFIDVHGDNEAYVPLGLLSSLSGGIEGYNIAYNGKDIYVLDSRGQLSEEQRSYKYYGDSYLSVMKDFEIKRPEDLAKYSYYQLCFNFDNLRGYTTQLIFGDNNLQSLGLNGLLERYYPDVKSLMMSTDKNEYYAGFSLALYGLFDGGHTAAEITNEPFFADSQSAILTKPELKDLASKFVFAYLQKLATKTGYMQSKIASFPGLYSAENANYYSFDSETKTAYIGFDSFQVDYAQWTKYYNKGKKQSDIPTSGDSYAFIRSSLYKALEDNAKNVVLDLSTNGGGDSGALLGIVGLFNKAKANYESNNIVDGTRRTEENLIDINLDGKWDDKDVKEAEKFEAMNVAVLTSRNSFSCGNLLPSMLKELGYKIVGQRSGGGSCAIVYETTVDGLTYYRSSHHCLSNLSGDNIDDGVPLDFEIEITKTPNASNPKLYDVNAPKFYDFVTVANYLNSL